MTPAQWGGWRRKGRGRGGGGGERGKSAKGGEEEEWRKPGRPDEAMKGSHSFASQFPLFAAVVANLRQVRYEWPPMKKMRVSERKQLRGGF